MPVPTLTLRRLGMVQACSTGAGVEDHWRWHKLCALSSEWSRDWVCQEVRRPWRMKTRPHEVVIVGHGLKERNGNGNMVGIGMPKVF